MYNYIMLSVLFQYQFLNSKLRRHELVVVELCERDSNQTRYILSVA